MTVNITFSNISGGDSLSDTTDLGSATPATDTDIQDVFIRHDAIVNEITDCAWYLQRYVGSNYLGADEDDDFIEVMACPGGCIGGGGQHIGATEEDLKARMKSLYKIDENGTIKCSHKNSEVIELYNNYLGEPSSHKCHELLHTHYGKRNVLL